MRRFARSRPQACRPSRLNATQSSATSSIGKLPSIERVPGQLGDDPVDGVGEQLGVAIDDPAVDDAVLQMPDRVGDRDLTVAGEHRRERLVGRRELDDREVLPVLGEPGKGGPDAELDAADRIVDTLDRVLLALAQVVVRRLQELGEQLLLRGEVPVEDALADAERGDDVGHRSRVIAALGEQAGGAGHQLLTPFFAPGRELAPHSPSVAVCLTARSTNRRP